MYNLDFLEDEKLVGIFDEIFVKQGENKKNTTIALTNMRLLFLDYIVPDEGQEVLRIARGANYFRYKEIYYQIDLKDIAKVTEGEYYQVALKNKVSFEFNNEDLYELLKEFSN